MLKGRRAHEGPALAGLDARHDPRLRTVPLLLRDPRLSPGTETEVTWFEPGCTDEYKYKLSKSAISGDLFEQAGRSQVFEVEQNVVEPGDHLVTVWSDAVCRYLLRVEVLLQDN